VSEQAADNDPLWLQAFAGIQSLGETLLPPGVYWEPCHGRQQHQEFPLPSFGEQSYPKPCKFTSSKTNC